MTSTLNFPRLAAGDAAIPWALRVQSHLRNDAHNNATQALAKYLRTGDKG